MRTLNLLILALLSLPISARAFTPYADSLPIPRRIIVPAGTAEITLHMQQLRTQFHRDLPEATVWGYEGSSPGPTIEVESGQSLRVHWVNSLPEKHFIPLPKGAEMDPAHPLPDVRAVVHLHGAAVTQPSITDRLHNNDGWPDLWITPGQEQIAEYPNLQSARTLWYHDHAISTTGRNVTAGLAGIYIIHDEFERSLNLPSGEYDIPLVIQPRLLKGDGSIGYTSTLERENYGNASFVNGKLLPYLEVEPRKYRFRFVNAANARTAALRLLTDNDDTRTGPAFHQIGSDAGFLEKPVLLNDPADIKAPRLVLAPAERADVIIDFSGYEGREFILNNNAKPDDADAAMPLYETMLFRVGKTLKQPDTSSLPTQLRTITRLNPAQTAQSRQIVLGQMDMRGMAMQTLNGKMWTDPVTERPALGSTEVWELVNTLPDTHPFHIHLVEFQVLDRRPYDVEEYLKSGKINFTGEAVAPDANEMGWKDTVRAPTGYITRIIVKFAPYAGHYIYHCHILEHEDMDMMRPFEIVDPKDLQAPLAP